MRKRLFIVMPAYNEEQNIEEVITSWQKKLENKYLDATFVINIKGSTDKTYEKLTQLNKKFDNIKILSTPETDNCHGAKIFELYDYAIKSGADYIFQTDSDGQTNPDEFDAFWDMRHSCDCIIGQREYRGDGFIRDIVEKILCLLIRIYFGVRIKDANAPFRLMKVNIIKKYLYMIPKNYILPNVMISTYLCLFKEDIQWKNITFKARKAGKNTINVVNILKIGIKSLKDFYIFRSNLKNIINITL